MADRFNCYEMLANEMLEGRDYRIVQEVPPDSIAAIVAPHGGKIESHTSELARIIAEPSFAFYSFLGTLPKKNRDLHVTSHNFDEPIALDLVANVDVVLGIHGMQDRADGVDVCLGGLDAYFVEILADELDAVGIRSLKSGHDFPAMHPKNICNRGRTEAGAQLELSLSLRNALFNSDSRFDRLAFVDSVKRAVNMRIG